MTFRASSTLPVTFESMDTASLNLDPKFLRFLLNRSAVVLSSGSSSSPVPRSTYATRDDRRRWDTLAISCELRPWLKSMLYPPPGRTPMLYTCVASHMVRLYAAMVL